MAARCLFLLMVITGHIIKANANRNVIDFLCEFSRLCNVFNVFFYGQYIYLLTLTENSI